MRHWREPDADARQDEVTRTRLMLQQFPAVPALKEIMARASGREAWRRLRPPLVNLSSDDAARLIDEAETAGLLDAVRA
jgi:4-hydroxy-tetrahydrodipicolinate synthase